MGMALVQRGRNDEKMQKHMNFKEYTVSNMPSGFCVVVTEDFFKKRGC